MGPLRSVAVALLAGALAVALGGCGATTATAPVDPLASQVRQLLPPGATLVEPPVLGTQPGALPYVVPLTAPGAQDVVALYVSGTPAPGIAQDCTGPRSATTRNAPCHVLVAAPTAGGRLRALWQWSPGGYELGQLTTESFTGADVPELFVWFPVGSTFSAIRVVSFAGGRANVLLAAEGGSPQVLAAETPGTLPGLAFRHHDTGGAGTWVVWRWDAALHRMVRADGAFPAFYQKEAKAAPLTPAGAAWVDYYAALVHLQAVENAQALQLAQRGLGGAGYMKGSPAFHEIEATVYRRQGDCGQAVPLYQKVVSSASPGGGIGWPALSRSYYGLAMCAQGAGSLALAKAYAQKAIAASPTDDWYGYARAEALLAK